MCFTTEPSNPILWRFGRFCWLLLAQHSLLCVAVHASGWCALPSAVGNNVNAMMLNSIERSSTWRVLCDYKTCNVDVPNVIRSVTLRSRVCTFLRRSVSIYSWASIIVAHSMIVHACNNNICNTTLAFLHTSYILYGKGGRGYDNFCSASKVVRLRWGLVPPKYGIQPAQFTSIQHFRSLL